MKFWRPRITVIAGALLLAGVLSGPFFSTQAHAFLAVCRDDPTVSLSNGQSTTMWSATSTTLSNITGFYYVLHIPSNLKVTSITYGNYPSMEHVTVIADQTGTQFYSVTTVKTINGNFAVTAYATRMDSTVASKNGTSNSSITMHWTT